MRFWRRFRTMLAAAGAALAISMVPGVAPTVWAGPCEEEPYCHPDLQRPCNGDACRCWECYSAAEICCLGPIMN